VAPLNAPLADVKRLHVANELPPLDVVPSHTRENIVLFFVSLLWHSPRPAQLSHQSKLSRKWGQDPLDPIDEMHDSDYQ
jgi:hypothetical protein